VALLPRLACATTTSACVPAHTPVNARTQSQGAHIA
jgi:hypothetical protein